MELANKVGAADIINRVVDDLKDENEQYRKMVMETIEKVCCVSSPVHRFVLMSLLFMIHGWSY